MVASQSVLLMMLNMAIGHPYDNNVLLLITASVNQNQGWIKGEGGRQNHLMMFI